MILENKKILVTGVDGFIGRHLTEALVHLGCNVKAFVFYNSFGSNGWLDKLLPDFLSKIEVCQGDIRDPFFVNEVMKDVDICFHLAALIAIPYSYISPSSYIETNIKGTHNILEAAKNNNCKKILITSTSEVYGTAKYTPIDESHPFQGQSPYSASKIASDRLAESFLRSFDLPISIVRPFNTFGPRQSNRAIIPTIITQLLDGFNEIKLGNTLALRDFTYISDTVNGFIEIAKSDTTIGEEINIATQSEISISDLFDILIKKINPNAKIIQDNLRLRPTKSEVDRLLGSNKKLMKLTSWSQSVSLEDGLDKTIAWFSKPTNLLLYNSNIYNK